MNDLRIHPETVSFGILKREVEVSGWYPDDGRRVHLQTESLSVETPAVQVKPLVWECHGGVDYISDRYVVRVFFGSDQYYFETWDLSLGRKLYDGDDLPSAKSAAQTDYNSRQGHQTKGSK